MTTERVVLSGVAIDNVSMDEAVHAIDRMIDTGGFHQIATANVDFLRRTLHDSELLDILRKCTLVLADGMPLVWASRWMGVPLRERVTGADLIPRLLHLSADKGRRIFLLGATEERSAQAALRIQKDYPGAQICGRFCPPFGPLETMDHQAILDAITAAQPDILLVAFGCPKQEKWLNMHRDMLKVPVCVGVGASIDFLSGHQSRAPEWLQRTGMEWVYRLASEPRRLAMRYIEDALYVLQHLSAQMMASSLQPRGGAPGEAALLESGHGTITVLLTGVITTDLIRRLSFDLNNRMQSCAALIVDLGGAVSLPANAVALLAELARSCAAHNAQMCVTGARRSLRELFRATFPSGLPFQTALTPQQALGAMLPVDPAARAIGTANNGARSTKTLRASLSSDLEGS
jgi:N-acetylglucosaminyldiphosphoundecaprenol N-acetyl-beta-D-mannosaminyltransferase